MDSLDSYQGLVDALARDPGVPFWVRDLVAKLAGKDPLDVAYWLGVVQMVEQKRADEALRGAEEEQE